MSFTAYKSRFYQHLKLLLGVEGLNKGQYVSDGTLRVPFEQGVTPEQFADRHYDDVYRC